MMESKVRWNFIIIIRKESDEDERQSQSRFLRKKQDIEKELIELKEEIELARRE